MRVELSSLKLRRANGVEWNCTLHNRLPMVARGCVSVMILSALAVDLVLGEL